jgi:hypothetical protein
MTGHSGQGDRTRPVTTGKREQCVSEVTVAMTGRAGQLTGRADCLAPRAREATTGRALANDRTR